MKVILGVSGSRYYRNIHGEDKEFYPDVSIYLPDKVLKHVSIIYHGGAIGFDRAVVDYVKERYPEIKLEPLRPDYKKGKTPEVLAWNKQAPIVRNKLIVEKSHLIIAVSSHKNSKGTQSTIDYAKELNKKYCHWILDYSEYLTMETIYQMGIN